MSRRKFIRQSTLLAGGVLLNSHLATAFTGKVEKKIKTGIIGCGDRGRGIMHVLKQLPDNFEITAICDVLDFRLKAASGVKPDARQYTAYRKLLDDKSIAAVMIAVPLNMHHLIAVHALQAGKHVYLEKTMTYSIPEALDLVKQAKKYPKQVLQVGHQYRYTP